MRAEGTRALRVAARLHLAGSSVGRSGVGVRPRADVDGSARMSPGDLAEWRRAATLSERASPGSFWDAVTVVAAEMAREMDEQWREERRERRDAGARDGVPERPHPLAVAARRNEVVWELIFVAARARRAGGHETAPESAGWSERAWAAVSAALASSPIPPPADAPPALVPVGVEARDAFGFDLGAYAAAVASRVAALVAAWPRCASLRGPAWVIWRRVVGAGKTADDDWS